MKTEVIEIRSTQLGNELHIDGHFRGTVEEYKSDGDTMRYAESMNIPEGEIRRLTGQTYAFKNPTGGYIFFRKWGR